MNYPVNESASQLSLWCSIPGAHLGTRESGIAMWLGVPAARGCGAGQARVSSTKGDPSLKSKSHKLVLSWGFLLGLGTKQESLLIGRSPGERELQHFHQQLRFHCWDNYGEWVKTQAAISCSGSLSPWNIYPLRWSSPRRWKIWCFFTSSVVYCGIWTFLLS